VTSPEQLPRAASRNDTREKRTLTSARNPVRLDAPECFQFLQDKEIV
jgi:hypothetical protein